MELPSEYNTLQKIAAALKEFKEQFSFQSGVGIEWGEDWTTEDNLIILQVCDTSTGNKLQAGIDLTSNQFGHRGYNATSETWGEWQIHDNSAKETYSVLAYSANYSAVNGSGVSNMPTSTIVVVGNTYVVSSDIPTCTGYTFSGWNTAEDGSGTSYSAGSAITITSEDSVTLYAQWAINTYTVTFYNKDNSVNSTYTVEYGSTVSTLPTAASVTGYSFDYWYYEENGTKLTFTTDVSVISNISVYGSYSEVYISIRVYYPVATSASATEITWTGGTVTVQEGTTWSGLSLSGYKNVYSGWTMSTTYYSDSSLSTAYSSSAVIASGNAAYLKYIYTNSTTTALPKFYYVYSKNASTVVDTGKSGSGTNIVFGTSWSDILGTWSSNYSSTIDDYTLAPDIYTDSSCSSIFTTTAYPLFTDKTVYESLYANYYTTYTATFSISAPYLAARTVTSNGVTYDVDAYELSMDYISYTGETSITGTSIESIILPEDVPMLTTSTKYFTCVGWKSSYNNRVCDPGEDVILYDDTEFTPVWESNYLSSAITMYNIGAGTDEDDDSLYASDSSYLEYEIAGKTATLADEVVVITNPLDYLVDQFKADTTWNPDGIPGWQTSVASTYNPYDGNSYYSDGDYADIDISETKAYYIMTLIQMIHDYILAHSYYHNWYSSISLYPYWDVSIIYSVNNLTKTMYKSGEKYTSTDTPTIVSGSANNVSVRYGTSYTIPTVNIEYENHSIDSFTIEQFAGGVINDTIVDNLDLSQETYTLTMKYPVRVRVVTYGNTYTVTWVDYNGDTYATTNVKYGSTISIPSTAVPEEDGVEFNNRYLYEDGSEFVTGDTCDGNITIYPQYDMTVDTYTLKIYYYDVSSSSFKYYSSDVVSGTTISSTSAYTSFVTKYNDMLSSYNYEGMYTSSTFSDSTAYNTGNLTSFAATSVTSNLTVYAKFTTEVELLYSTNGGYSSSSQDFVYNVPLGRTYYSILGTASTIKTNVVKYETLPSGSFNWSYMYNGTLTKNYDNTSASTITGTKVSSSTICKDGSITTITALYVPTATGYLYLNSQNLADLGGSVKYVDDSSTTTTTVYTLSGLRGWYYTIPDVSDSTDIYTCKGWYTSTTSSTAAPKVNINGATCMQINVSANKTYYSQWYTDKTVTLNIYYYNSSGTQTYKSEEVTIGSSISDSSIYSTVSDMTFSASSGDSYTFGGVYSSNAYSGSDLSSNTLTTNTSVYAKFQRKVNINYTHNYGYTTGTYSNSVQGYLMLGKTVYASLNAVSGLFTAVKSEVDKSLSDYNCSGNYSAVYNTFSFNSPGTNISNVKCTTSTYYNTVCILYIPNTTATIKLYVTQLKTDLATTPYYLNDSGSIIDSGSDPYTITTRVNYHILLPKIVASIDGEDEADYVFSQWYSDEDLSEELSDTDSDGNEIWGTNNNARYIDVTGSVTAYSSWEEPREYKSKISIASRYVKDCVNGSTSYPTVNMTLYSTYYNIEVETNMKNAYQWGGTGSYISDKNEASYRSTLYETKYADTSISAVERDARVVFVTDFKLKTGDEIVVTTRYSYSDDDPFNASGSCANAGASITYGMSTVLLATTTASSVSSYNTIGTFVPSTCKLTSTAAKGASYTTTGAGNEDELISSTYTVDSAYNGRYLAFIFNMSEVSSSNSEIPITNNSTYTIDDDYDSSGETGMCTITTVNCRGTCKFQFYNLTVNGNKLIFTS